MFNKSSSLSMIIIFGSPLPKQFFLLFHLFLWGHFEVIWGILRSFEVILTSSVFVFAVFCFLLWLVFDDGKILERESIFISLLNGCIVDYDFFNSLAISDCFNFGLIDFSSKKFAILCNLFCLIIESALRSPVFDICSKDKVLFIIQVFKGNENYDCFVSLW